MTNIVTVEKKVLKLLEEYVGGTIQDPLKALNKFKDDELSFYIRFNKHNTNHKDKSVYINAPAAKIIVDFQETIYRIAALSIHGRADIRALTKAEKQKLEVPFRVRKGSGIEEINEFLKYIKEVLNMIPERQRAGTLVALLLILFGYLGWGEYLEYKEKNQNTEIVKLAIEKLGNENSALINVVKSHEKEQLNTLSEIDEEVETQGRKYTSEDLKEIKKQKFPNKNTKQIQSIKGNYSIIDINIKKSYMTVEGDIDADPIRILYEADDSLLTRMQNIKENLHKAIDDEGKKFYIEATVLKKNGKIDTRILSKIEELK